jgi:CARDB protein
VRLRTTTTGALVCAAATAAALALAVPALPSKPTHGAYVVKCNKANHSAAFLGTMRTVRDTERMWMRFTLLERTLPGKGLHPVSVPALEVWHKSRPGVERFSFRQRVRALAEAAIYKTDVEFRWYGEDGKLLRQAIKRSGRCRQPGELPNLRVQNITYRQGRYRARVINVGRDSATGAAVQLFVDGQDVGTKELPDIAPGELAVADFDGLPCIGSVQAVVDPAALVRESAEDDNALTESCAALRSR